MMWPFKKHAAPPEPTPVSSGATMPIPTGGAVAHKRAEDNLAQQRAKQPEVSRVATSLRELRERNHFALQVRLIFQGENLNEH